MEQASEQALKVLDPEEVVVPSVEQVQKVLDVLLEVLFQSTHSPSLDFQLVEVVLLVVVVDRLYRPSFSFLHFPVSSLLFFVVKSSPRIAAVMCNNI